MDGNRGPRRPAHPDVSFPLAALGARIDLGGIVATASSEFVIDRARGKWHPRGMPVLDLCVPRMFPAPFHQGDLLHWAAVG
jgi:hypothetical protein